MKLAFRAFTICVVLAGAAAVSMSPATTGAIPGHQSATAGLPVPLCGPWEPCPPDQPNGNALPASNK